MNGIPYNPGVIPSKPAPEAGEEIRFKVEGLPPYKDLGQSIRTRKHKAHDRFILLREKAIEAMAGRAWSFEAIELILLLYGNPDNFDKTSWDYIAGIMDTLDGSSGQTFTFLPIVYEDDCQVYSGGFEIKEAKEEAYEILIKFGTTDTLNKANHSRFARTR